MDNALFEKEIDLIQGRINRMASNSFYIKGWAMTLLVGVLAFSWKELADSFVMLIVCILIPFLCFWYLDAMYLHIEREYRKMYEWIIKERPLNNEEHLLELNPKRFSSEVSCVFFIMFSKSLLPFYGIPAIGILFLILNVHFELFP